MPVAELVGSRPNTRSVRATLEAAFRDGLLPAARGSLPRGHISIFGEVLEIRNLDRVRILTLLDNEDHEEFIQVVFQAESLPPPLDSAIEIEGVFDLYARDGSIKLQVRGEAWSFDESRKSRRARWSEVAQRLKEGHSPMPLKGPIRKVAVVTGEHSRSRTDFEHAVRRDVGVKRDASSRIEIEQVNVVLKDPEDIARGIREAATCADVGAIVVVRGGGPRVEILAFDHPDVLEAIREVSARVPLVTGIGHAEDETLADGLASARCSTPSAVGDLIRETNACQEPPRALVSFAMATVEAPSFSPRIDRRGDPSAGHGPNGSGRAKIDPPPVKREPSSWHPPPIPARSEPVYRPEPAREPDPPEGFLARFGRAVRKWVRRLVIAAFFAAVGWFAAKWSERAERRDVAPPEGLISMPRPAPAAVMQTPTIERAPVRSAPKRRRQKTPRPAAGMDIPRIEDRPLPPSGL
jgi:hypothetical protein